jgi:HPr kinase/phosphorylase
MPANSQTESRHGVMVCINGKGLLITGEAGIGKSSLALELITDGHQLVADDIVDISVSDNGLIASCPKMLKGLLHSRELGTIDIVQSFSAEAIKAQSSLDYVLELRAQSDFPPSLEAKQPPAIILGTAIPKLCLAINNPASILSRLLIWLKMQQQSDDASQTLKLRQHQQMQQQ